MVVWRVVICGEDALQRVLAVFVGDFPGDTVTWNPRSILAMLAERGRIRLGHAPFGLAFLLVHAYSIGPFVPQRKPRIA